MESNDKTTSQSSRSSLDNSDDEEFYSFESDEDEQKQKSVKQDGHKGENIEKNLEILQKRKDSKLEVRKEEPEMEFIVKNLDTGESFSSKLIDEFIPKGVDPLSALLLKRTPAPQDSPLQPESSSQTQTKKPHTLRNPAEKKHKWLSRLRRNKSESYVHYATDPSEKEQEHQNDKQQKGEAKAKKKKLFAQVSRQVIVHHSGAVWVMKFNYDGLLFASAGNDTIIRIWKVLEQNDVAEEFFSSQPLCLLEGHTGDILALAWTNSRSNLLISASMDKTVRLWNINAKGAKFVCSFNHDDIVTSVAFHPKNEELFLTGSLDGQLRIWNVPERKVTRTSTVNCGFITSLAITHGGETVIVGSYDGRCSFYETEGLKWKTQRYVKSRGNAKTGKKITGIDIMPGGKTILITSNDSRVRLYDLSDHSLSCTYKGLENNNFQISASSSEKGNYIICGSEDHHVYIWDTHESTRSILRVTPGDVNLHYDSFQAHSSCVSVALFAPCSKRKTKMKEEQIIVTADTTGEIRVFENKPVINHSL